jgi:beta-galactosidase
MPGIEIRDGIFYLNNRPELLVSADYPYYRDDPEDWPGQLDNIKKMGVNTVTFYTPWRHHSVKDGEYDFNGKRRPNTDVIWFLGLIHKREMRAIVKPGPFIHAETNFGGLPEYVGGDPVNGIEPMLNAAQEPKIWNHPLPAPLGENFTKKLGGWLNAVSENVIKGREYPRGPIIGIQILNEGIFSNSADKVTAYDYSSSGIANFREFLKDKYKTISGLNNEYRTSYASFNDIYPPKEFGAASLRGLSRYLDWAEASSFFYRSVMKSYLDMLGTGIKGIPVILNLNLCGDGRDAEIYAVRNNPHLLKDQACWGYTDWAGPLAGSEEACRKYRLVTGFARGMCMEENWGFSKIYNPVYKFVQPSFYQSMYYLALGSTGLNIYTGVSTDNWDKYLDDSHEAPYPSHAPISEKGEFRPQFAAVRQLSMYMSHEGRELVASESRAEIAWAVYSPYCRAACWLQDKEKWREIGLSSPPVNIHGGLDTFQRVMAFNTIESGVVFAQEAGDEELGRYKVICFYGNDWLDNDTLEKLARYVKRGGILIWNGAIPVMDEKWEDNSARVRELLSVPVKNGISGGTFVNKLGAGKVVYLAFNPWEENGFERNASMMFEILRNHCGMRDPGHVSKEDRGAVEVYERTDKNSGKQYVFVFNKNENNRTFQVNFDGIGGGAEKFDIQLTGYSLAVACFRNGELESALIKGINDELDISSAPYIRYRDRVVRAGGPGDLVFYKKGKSLFFDFNGLQSNTAVEFPKSYGAAEFLTV